ncbi:hypothetical protein [Bradyrhizobium sp.]|uniref:hypothetical protein n=1 Tax=Bradyrhizobium sp. TaxID=376 RepID=UPI00262BCBB9|nr:hypothetical protein [Bradyrhizobium sp.]
MRKLLVTAIFVFLMAGPAAVAQAGNSSLGKQGPWPAPVGHRQPRADQVPSEKDIGNNGANANNAMKREDAELDRKLKSICRGC